MTKLQQEYQEYLEQNRKKNEGLNELQQMSNPAFSFKAWKKGKKHIAGLSTIKD